MPETVLSHKHLLHPKSFINFEDEKKTRIEWGNMTRSCIKCGYFVSTPTPSEKHIGYCLCFKLRNIDIEKSGENINIINGEEREIAIRCEGYFDVVKHYS